MDLFQNLPEGFRLVKDEFDHKLASLTVTQAFADYAYPVPSTEISHSAYMKFYYHLAELWISNAEKVGTVLTNDDYSAVMVLTPADKSAVISEDLIREQLGSCAGPEAVENALQIMNYIYLAEEDLSFRENTVYIEAFAVQTARQGQKLGSKLMRKLFEACDAQGRDLLLFTNTERNVSIYKHFGFDVIKHTAVEELNSFTDFMLRRCQDPGEKTE